MTGRLLVLTLLAGAGLLAAAGPAAALPEDTLAGVVFADRCGDGDLDPADGDTPIADVALTLSGTADDGTPVAATALSAADGSWGFAVGPGTYRVVETQPAAFDDGPDTPGDGAVRDGDDAVTVALRPGARSTGTAFAELARAGLSGAVYVDTDADGARGPREGGLGAVALTVTGEDDAGHPVALATATGADGRWSLGRLRAGSYTVTATRPAGYRPGPLRPGSAGGRAAPPDAITAVALDGDTAATGYDFPARGATLAGRVVDGDAGVPGVPVTVSGADARGEAVLRSATSGETGEWAVPGLPAGTYAVSAPVPAGFGDGPDAAGSAGGTADGPNALAGVALPAGERADGYVLGLRRSALSGRVTVADGPGLGGVGVALTGTDVGGGAVSRRAVTAPDGTFRLDGLLAGTYTLVETQPPGYLDGPDAAGPAGGVATAPDAVAGIALPAGTAVVGYEFTERGAELAGRVAPGGGPGVAGVPVTVDGTDAAGHGVRRTVDTGPDGAFAVPGLPGGTYTLSAPVPAGYGAGPVTAGAAGGRPGGPGAVAGIALPVGGRAPGYVLGLAHSSLSGRVGPAGAPGVGGVAVTVTGTDATGAAVSRSTRTAPDGAYRVDGLLAGDYTLTATRAPGYLDGPAAAGSAGGVPSGPGTVAAIALPAGTDAVGYDVAPRGAALSGRVTAGSGAGVAGVPVGVSGPVPRTATTGADGAWTVPGLPAGTYAVAVAEQPVGYGEGTAVAGTAGGTPDGPRAIRGVELAPGAHGAGYRVDLAVGALAGRVSAGDVGVPGARLTVTGTDAAGAAVGRTVTTGPDGDFRVDGLLGGVYALVQTQPPGFGDGPERPGSLGGTPAGPDTVDGIVVPPGGEGVGYEFTERGSSLAGTVLASGAGLAGVPVSVAGTDVAGSPVARTAATGPEGAFAVGGLPAGTYAVSVPRPAGYGDGPAVAGTAGGTPGGPNSLTAVTLAQGQDATGYTFTATLGSLAGAVYLDRDDDGARGADEPGLAGVTVTVTGRDATGTDVRRTAVTDVRGGWLVDRLAAGEYTATESQPAAWADGRAAAGTARGSAVGPDVVERIVLPPAVAATGYDFGERGATLGGRVVDGDGDGVAGVAVTVSGDGRPDLAVRTGADGSWRVADLPAGTYAAAVRVPAGYAGGSAAPGTAGGEAADPARITGVALDPGASGTGYRFRLALGSLAGRVWADVDGDGEVGTDEPGIAGVRVVVTGEDVTGRAVTRAAATGRDGRYRVPGLPAGTYRVAETQPAGHDDGRDRVGTAGGTLDPPDAVAGVVLGAGVDATGYDFGERPAEVPIPTPAPAGPSAPPAAEPAPTAEAPRGRSRSVSL